MQPVHALFPTEDAGTVWCPSGEGGWSQNNLFDLLPHHLLAEVFPRENLLAQAVESDIYWAVTSHVYLVDEYNNFHLASSRPARGLLRKTVGSQSWFHALGPRGQIYSTPNWREGTPLKEQAVLQTRLLQTPAWQGTGHLLRLMEHLPVCTQYSFRVDIRLEPRKAMTG